MLGTLHEDVSAFHTVDSNTCNSTVPDNSSTIENMLLDHHSNTFNIYIWTAAHIAQQYILISILCIEQY
jgi:hypothetical protein